MVINCYDLNYHKSSFTKQTKKKSFKRMKRYIILTIITLFVFSASHAQRKRNFVREYTYRAGDTDSKVSSRVNALNEVKILLLEEIGTYVESYVNYETTEENGKLTKDFFTNEIKTLSAGITETEILDEAWDGYNYYVKAKIKADPEEVIRLINQSLVERKSSVVIDSLQILLKYYDVKIRANEEELKEVQLKVEEKNGIIENINSELSNLNGELSSFSVRLEDKENNIQQLQKELSNVKLKLVEYQREEEEIKNEIEKLLDKLKSNGEKALKTARIGMIYDEFDFIRRSEAHFAKRTYFELYIPKGNGYSDKYICVAYGDTWVSFKQEGNEYPYPTKNDLITGVYKHDKMMLIKNADPSKREHLLKEYNIGTKLF